MTFDGRTAESLFCDAALVSALLLVGQVLRAKIALLQKLRFPASLTAGLLALAFGPNGMQWIPLSKQLASYPSLLVILVFAAVPIGAKFADRKRLGGDVGEMWSHVSFGILAQYGWGMLLGLFVLGAFWELHPGFGLVLGLGFFGGPGTAAAAGSSFKAHHWDDALSLGMTSATVGIVAAIVGGIILANWGRRKGLCQGADPSEADAEQGLLTGLIPERSRKPLGVETVSSSSLDTVSFHLSLIMIAAISGWYGSKFFKTLWPSVEIPAFGLALIAGYLLQGSLKITGTDRHVDQRIVSRLSGTTVDYLVALGIAAIEVPRVIQYAVPLGFLFAFGVILCLLQALVLGPRMFREYWFEKSTFVWGFNTGTLAQSVMLLRMIDPGTKSRSLEIYGLVDMLIKPFSLGCLVAGPALISAGYAVHFAVVCSILAFAPLVLAKAVGWWNPGRKK
ncbi:MAG: sodium/glutamate symporter [bacterium]